MQDGCDLDHETCHICLKPGHVALQCEIYKDEAAFQEFCHKFTLKNTRPDDYPTYKTVLGDVILWMQQVQLPSLDLFRLGEDDQLHRCRKQKRIESEWLLSLSEGSSYVDVGAHLGDSVLTMALFARRHGRDDLQFLAIEPSRIKCEYMRSVVAANGLQHTVEVIQAAVGDKEQLVIPDPKAKERAICNGSLMYQTVAISDENPLASQDDDTVPMITLDSLQERICSLGILHIDVEGWESQVLMGAIELLSRKCGTPCYIIAEAWTPAQSQRRSGLDDAQGSIVQAITAHHASFERVDDIVDVERNVVFRKKIIYE